MSKIKSSLAKSLASAFGPEDARRSAQLCQGAWRQLGLLVVYAADPELSWDQRAFVVQIGTRKFGRSPVVAPPALAPADEG
jgi:hypothetical protein